MIGISGSREVADAEGKEGDATDAGLCSVLFGLCQRSYSL
jgi:hypothetical protein